MSQHVLLPPAVMPDSEAQLREQVREFLSTTPFEPRVDPMIDGYDPEFSLALARRGFVGLVIPREYGGHGRSPLERFIVIEELLAAGAPVSAHWTADRQVAPNLLAFGSELLKKRYLPAIARGECFFAIGLSEPDSGSDLASIRTRARPTPGGWRLTGRKIWTSMAQHAHAIVVLARSAERGADLHVEMSQFVVPLACEGIQVRPITGLAGRSHFNEVIFDDVFIPDVMLLGEQNAGWRQVMAELAYERSGPDRLLSTFRLVRRTSGDARGQLLARLWSLRQASMAVNAAIERGTASALQSAMVKDLGAEFEREVLDLALRDNPIEPDQTSPDPVARELANALFQAPTLTLRGGTTEILRGIVARGLGLR